MNRRTKAGVLDPLFVELQREQLIRIRIEAVSLDSAIIKVHPDSTGALKNSYRGICPVSSHRMSPFSVMSVLEVFDRS